MAIFDLAFEKTLELEGGYKLHTVEGDRGGMTYAGISRNNWPEWPGWGMIDDGKINARELVSFVQLFYKVQFWDKICGDQIAFQGVADVIYDFAVNAGLRTAVKTAQRIVGAMPDGVVGQNTIKKLSQFVIDETSEKLFVAIYGLARICYYKDICLDDRRRCMDRVGSNLKFLCGWINRVEQAHV